MIYDNHQFHISCRRGLDETRGTEFPSFLFYKNLYPINTGLTPSSNSTELWWTSWWNRNITD
jgi:hypothetical protein